MLPNPYIPDHWTPEQALAVYEFLDALRERVWDQYREPIIEQLRADCQANPKDHAQLNLFPFNDDIPFSVERPRQHAYPFLPHQTV